MVTRGNTYFSKLYPQSKQYISKAVLNSRKAIKVILIGRTSDGKDLKTCRYYLEAGNYFYLLAFFSTVHDQELLYNKEAEEAELSFKIADEQKQGISKQLIQHPIIRHPFLVPFPS